MTASRAKRQPRRKLFHAKIRSCKRKIRDVPDPATGKIIRTLVDAVGTLNITEVDENSAVGKFTGAGPAKVGDMVSNK